jgi:phosphoglycerate dehydrogenase-like enzyme
MHTHFALQAMIWCLLWIVAQGQSSALASTVKVLVGAGYKQQWADLEKRHPNLELVAADRGGIADVIADCDAIIGLPYGDKGREILRRGKKLRWVHSTSAGVEKIVHLPELRDSDITVTNAKIMMGPEIADHVFALLLTLTRNLKQYDREMDRGTWKRGATRLPMIELRHKTMLIIGLGGIGSQVAQRAAAFGMRVLGVDPKDIPLSRDVEKVVVPDQLHRVLPEADVVVSCVPHTPASEGMLGAAEFAAMKDGVYVVNVSRGKVIQTEALLAALRSGKVRAAGLDVTDPEPLPPDHPLWKMDNVLITPHVATRSDRSGERLTNLIRDNIERFVTGRTLRHVVDKAAGY